MGTGRCRIRAEIEALLPGLELVDPGLVRLHEWRPDAPAERELNLVEHLVLALWAAKR